MWLVLVWQAEDGIAGLEPFGLDLFDLARLARRVAAHMLNGRPFHIFPVRRKVLDWDTQLALFDAFHRMFA